MFISPVVDALIIGKSDVHIGSIISEFVLPGTMLFRVNGTPASSGALLRFV
jgi:hypothetical protein